MILDVFSSESKSYNSCKALNCFIGCVFCPCGRIHHLLNIIDIIFPVHWKASIQRFFCFLNQHARHDKFVRKIMREKAVHCFLTDFIYPIRNLLFIPHCAFQHRFTCLRNTLVYFFWGPGRIIITFFCHFITCIF